MTTDLLVGGKPLAVTIRPDGLHGLLGIPTSPKGLVIFAHGSGSGRLSPRNNHVASGLREAGLATLLIDLLTPDEEQDRTKVFDIPLLASRLSGAATWVRLVPELRRLPIGYFGASTGAGAALLAASTAGSDIAAIVSRGGRPDLAGAKALARVRAATLLIVGSRDVPVIDLNRVAMRHLRVEKQLVIVPGATHLFEEPGTLDEVIRHATGWFARHFEEVGR
ncbi:MULTISPECIES: dienelactone hydrolase family protein [unclassified Sphingomonas]|uniref:dienelactone hydrolase family protein n=1 Tax=unclassified Sphingomonas TaxID=196159 RepID=UPI0006F669F7|nr:MULTISPECIES: alpha/beta family hydrolase [unclassified Sphingomonas]KQX20049.1 hydrolase [Sphingomonas sp. Root1294]KQY67299.1 hydrolase [Sphingomonas sp. Root50]KRB90674.1 hydrolase [Sphingomonas sp. Root720]